MKRKSTLSTADVEPSSKKACPEKVGERQHGHGLADDRAGSLYDNFHKRTSSLRQLLQEVLKNKASATGKVSHKVTSGLIAQSCSLEAALGTK